jgi:putative permease
MLERRGLSRCRVIVLLYAVLGLVSIFAALVVVPFIGLKWQQFLVDLPSHLQKAQDLIAGWKSHYLPLVAATGWGWLVDTVSVQAESTAETVFSGAYAAATSVLFNTVNILLAPILGFFMLIYKVPAGDGILACVPPARRRMVADLGHEINSSIGGYLRGQLMVSLIVALLSIMALFYLDVDYPVLNGIFAGLASVLPFIGVILATIPPLFFAYVKFQSLVAIGQVVMAFALIYFIEGYVIKPLVFKKAMEMNPLTTIIAVMACGEIMGFWGILLAIPLAAATRIVIEHARKGDFQGDDHDATTC